MSENSSKMASKKPILAKNKEAEMSELKKNAQLVNDWYQSYYLWNSTVMATSILNSNLINHGSRVLNMPLNNNTPFTPNPLFSPSNVQNEVPNLLANINQPVQQIPAPIVTTFKIPSLIRRLIAELFDAFYIQFVKILFALILLNYTELM